MQACHMHTCTPVSTPAHLHQMAEIASDTMTNESFMAQYGWLDRHPVTEDRSGQEPTVIELKQQ